MTTTTADKGRWRGRSLPRLLPVAAAVMLVSPACHADWRFQPAIGVTGTYSDNIDLQSDALAQTQLVTEIVPSFTLAVNSRRLKATASGQWRQYVYRDENVRPAADHQRAYAATLQSIVVDDLLMLDASAGASQQAISAFGPQVDSSPFSRENRTEVRTWSVSPYLVKNFGREAGAVLRYRRDAVDTGAERQFGNSTADTLQLNLYSGPAYGILGWGLDYTRQEQDNELSGTSSIENLAGNLRYRLDPTFSLTATAGHDRYDFEGPGGRTGGNSWSTGFSWTPSQRSSISASIGRRYFGTTGSLAANVRSRRTVWSVNYNDTITTSRSQFTLPAAVDTALLLDRLFTTTIPDPVQRQLAVAAYMLETGLPPSLADNINFLSNRYMRQKLLQAAAAFNWSRSSAVLSLNASQQNALSDQQSDSPLLGQQQAALNDKVRQRGATAAWTYRLNPRAGLVASATFSHRESLSRDIENYERELRFGMNRKLGRATFATVTLRRRSGAAASVFAPRDYKEHAITAALTMKL